MTLRFLGTGTSVGVPQIGCDCPVCTSDDPRDKRRRCGAYVTSGDTAVLIDTPPELRLACVEYGIAKVDAVLLTHAHMDHIAAFDDVRRFNTLNGVRVPCAPGDPQYRGLAWRIVGKSLDCYALPETIEAMHHIFPYISAQGASNGLYRPQIEFIDNTRAFSVGSIAVKAFRVEHSFPCCGYLLEDRQNGSRLGYVSDCHELSDQVIAALEGVDVMAIDCLRIREHPTHLTLERAKEYLARIKPKRAFLTHICHDLKHSQWQQMLSPSAIDVAYDGLAVDL